MADPGSNTPLAVDLLIIGAGPVGLYGAYYAGFRGMSVAVMDSLPEPGGQISALYPEKQIYDIAGFPQVRGRDLVSNLLAQAKPFRSTLLLGQSAQTLERRCDGTFGVVSSNSQQLVARAIVICGGIGTFTPRPLPPAADFQGRGLEYFVVRPDDYADKAVAIVGGGDSALDWALALQGLARSVTLIHRRDNFRAHEHSVQLLRCSDVTTLTPYVVADINGEQRAESLTLTNVKTGESLLLPCDAIIAALGFTADIGPLEQWGFDIAERRIVVDSRMETTLSRVYAAGDIADYPGKVRLISVGFGEVATAVNNAAVALNPDEPLFPGHSTDKVA